MNEYVEAYNRIIEKHNLAGPPLNEDTSDFLFVSIIQMAFWLFVEDDPANPDPDINLLRSFCQQYITP